MQQHQIQQQNAAAVAAAAIANSSTNSSTPSIGIGSGGSQLEQNMTEGTIPENILGELRLAHERIRILEVNKNYFYLTMELIYSTEPTTGWMLCNLRRQGTG
jgi:hypothetical protein